MGRNCDGSQLEEGKVFKVGEALSPSSLDECETVRTDPSERMNLFQLARHEQLKSAREGVLLGLHACSLLVGPTCLLLACKF